MTEPSGVDDDLRRIAARVADQISYDGYVHVEDDCVEDLALTLGRFLTEASIAVRPHPGDGEKRSGVRGHHVE